MIEELIQLESHALETLEGARDVDALEKFRIAFLGKKGRLTSLMKRLGELPPEKRPEAGSLGNRIKVNLQKRFQEARERLEARGAEDSDALDVTLSGRRPARGESGRCP